MEQLRGRFGLTAFILLLAVAAADALVETLLLDPTKSTLPLTPLLIDWIGSALAWILAVHWSSHDPQTRWSAAWMFAAAAAAIGAIGWAVALTADASALVAMVALGVAYVLLLPRLLTIPHWIVNGGQSLREATRSSWRASSGRFLTCLAVLLLSIIIPLPFAAVLLEVVQGPATLVLTVLLSTISATLVVTGAAALHAILPATADSNTRPHAQPDL